MKFKMGMSVEFEGTEEELLFLIAHCARFARRIQAK